MGGDGTIKKKRQQWVWAALSLFFVFAVGFLSFHLGRREGQAGQNGDKEAGGKLEGTAWWRLLVLQTDFPAISSWNRLRLP